MLEAANLPDDALERLPHNLQNRLRMGGREAVQLFADLSPGEQTRLFSGGSVTRPFGSWSGTAQARVQALVEKLERRHHESVDRTNAGTGPGAGKVFHRERPLDLQDGSDWRVQITPELNDVSSGQTNYFVYVYSSEAPGLGIGVGVWMTPPERRDPADSRLPRSGPAPEDPLSVVLVPHPYQPQGIGWEEIMRDLERALKRAIVSDAYLPSDYLAGAAPSTDPGEHLEEYLDRACRDAFNRRWGRRGGVLTFQRVDWPIYRRTQIPLSSLRWWKQHVIGTGSLRPEDLLDLASLTPHQLAHLGTIMGRPVADAVTQHQQLLLLWKAVPEGYRLRAKTSGIAIGDLPLGLQSQARSLVSSALGTTTPTVLANATVKFVQSPRAFTVAIACADRPAATYRIDVSFPSAWARLMRKEEEARIAALEKAVSAKATLTGPAAAP